MTGNQIIGKSSNDFNIFNEGHHNPMTNPLPHNVQNPYLLRDLMRKDQPIKHNATSSPSTRSNGIFYWNNSSTH